MYYSIRQNMQLYKDPGEFRRDCKSMGIGIPTSFCLAMSKLMAKHNMTFYEAYKLLEDSGYIAWIDNLLMYNMAGDRLWMHKSKNRS